ncbi:hypothetical protein PUNSTDRAFT_127619 [Punctularia strigosozonata HHB-11173 SS5]|uniref:uncharacterized protein n=1 Tax=Punctularia strigosozonata (strain HHB-11173) TaxID=741275 RepID=UPI0004416D76|nr:uncharacterized protein PUNSTDRAFT_127619 [Punctularia strigosozonata HHB-11173 SS5]EIN06269.1 hypothetical protein PUNSTDRAFT_127619 [Punctularia strigosozonata HHB-11173 SS5]
MDPSPSPPAVTSTTPTPMTRSGSLRTRSRLHGPRVPRPLTARTQPLVVDVPPPPLTASSSSDNLNPSSSAQQSSAPTYSAGFVYNGAGYVEGIPDELLSPPPDAPEPAYEPALATAVADSPTVLPFRSPTTGVPFPVPVPDTPAPAYPATPPPPPHPQLPLSRTQSQTQVQRGSPSPFPFPFREPLDTVDTGVQTAASSSLPPSPPPIPSASPPSITKVDVGVQALVPSPPPSPVPSHPTSTHKPTPAPTPKPSLVLLPPAAPLSFAPPPTPASPPYKGLTLHAAQWTFTSPQLQAIVARAIRQSAHEDALRILPLDCLDDAEGGDDGASAREARRVEAAAREAQARYRFLAQRRRMVLQGLCALASGGGGGNGGAGGGEEPEENVLGKLTLDLAALCAELDALAAALLAHAHALHTLRAAQHVHHSSALAIALRKLNASYAKRSRQLERAQRRVADLEGEVEEAWRVAEEVAREVDGREGRRGIEQMVEEMGFAYTDIVGGEAREESDEGREREDGDDDAEEEEEEDAEEESPLQGRSPVGNKTMVEEQTMAFGRVEPEPSEEALAARAALHRDPVEEEEEQDRPPNNEGHAPGHTPIEAAEVENATGTTTHDDAPEYDSALDSDSEDTGIQHQDVDEDDTGPLSGDIYDEGTIGIVNGVRAVASKAMLLAHPASPPPGTETFGPLPASIPLPPSVAGSSLGGSVPNSPSHAEPAAETAAEDAQPSASSNPAPTAPPQAPLPSPPSATELLSGLVTPPSVSASASRASSLIAPSPPPDSDSPVAAAPSAFARHHRSLSLGSFISTPASPPPLYIPSAPRAIAPVPRPHSDHERDEQTREGLNLPRLPTPVFPSPLSPPSDYSDPDGAMSPRRRERKMSAESAKSSASASRRVSAARKRSILKTKSGLRSPRTSTGPPGPGPAIRQRSRSRGRHSAKPSLSGGQLEAANSVAFPPVPSVPSEHQSTQSQRSTFLDLKPTPPIPGAAPAEDANSMIGRASFLDMERDRTPKASMMSSMADEDGSLVEATIRIPLANGAAERARGKTQDDHDIVPPPHRSAFSFLHHASSSAVQDMSDGEDGHEDVTKHASTQGIPPKSVRRASVSEYSSSYTYPKSPAGGSGSSATGRKSKSPRGAKSPERIGTVVASWLNLGALGKKGAKRHSSAIDRLVEEEGDGAANSGTGSGHARGQGSSESGAASGSGHGHASRIGYEKVLGLVSPKGRKDSKAIG